MCGCNNAPLPSNNPLPSPPSDPFPREPSMGSSRLPGFDLTLGTPSTGKVCSGWKINPNDATRETNLCCTPEVGRAGGVGYKAALCFKISRPYNPFA